MISKYHQKQSKQPCKNIFHPIKIHERRSKMETLSKVFVDKYNKYVKDFFTGSFTNHRLEQILDIFNASSGIKWRYIPSENKLDRKS